MSPNEMCACIQASYCSRASLFQKQARFSTTSKTARIEKVPCRGVESQYGCCSSGGALLCALHCCWVGHEWANSVLQELKIKTTSTKPIDGQKTGTSGLRKKTNVFTGENYLANWYKTLELGDLHTGVGWYTLIWAVGLEAHVMLSCKLSCCTGSSLCSTLLAMRSRAKQLVLVVMGVTTTKRLPSSSSRWPLPMESKRCPCAVYLTTSAVTQAHGSLCYIVHVLSVEQDYKHALLLRYLLAKMLSWPLRRCLL